MTSTFSEEPSERTKEAMKDYREAAGMKPASSEEKSRVCPLTINLTMNVPLTWHICDSQGQILALAFRRKSLTPF